MRRILFPGLIVILLAACSSAEAVKSFTKGEELAFYDFSTAGTFEEAAYADGAARLQIRDGVYTIALAEGDSELWYGQWGATYSDVIIDVEAHQFTESENTTYGVICRARGMVGQRAEGDPTLEALADEVSSIDSLIASAEEFESSAAEATEVATEEPTEEAVSDATAEADADATAEATVNADEEATAEATVNADKEATAEAVEDATEEPTEEAASDADAEATAEATVNADEEATAEATSDDSATLLNINNGDGYLFLIEGSGRFAIMRSRGRSVTPLVDWTNSSAINKGPAENRIRAVCMGDYLAMYINGTFAGDATDDTYAEGQVGLVAASADRLGLVVEFDNLSVSGVSPG